MTMRTNSKTIVFTRPFTLAGFNGMQPAGSYVVEADTLKVTSNDSSDPIGRRRSTLSRLHPQPGTDRDATVCPAELAAALLQDVAASALRFETHRRQEHRGAMKLVRDSGASDRIVEPGAADPGTDR